MATAALDHTYQYAFSSAIQDTSDGLLVSLATSGGVSDHPYFLRGRLTEPRMVADLLLALVRVVHSRFHIPPAMLARILAQSDPVVTCGEDRVRFEGFSACCSTYARVDLLPEAINGSLIATGTTNVDFNPEMRAELAKITDSGNVSLTIGKDSVELERDSINTVERKVALPFRWLKGFVEVQSHQSLMDLKFEIGAADAARFLSGLTKVGSSGKPVWVVRSGSGLRLSLMDSPGSIRVGGIERLRLLKEISRHIRLLRVYASPSSGASCWEVVTKVARFHLVLSPEVWRGFSGEGQVLDLLAADNEEETNGVRLALGWSSKLDVGELSSGLGISATVIRSALARLGASGLVGFDLAEGAYFHRELPFDLSRLKALQPRLIAARAIVEQGNVRIASKTSDSVTAWVTTSNGEQHVKVDLDGEKCSCPWYGKHTGDRGPCKHILAVQMVLEQRNRGSTS